MKTLAVSLLVASLALAGVAAAQEPDRDEVNRYYQLGPDSLPQEGVPKGAIEGPFIIPSEAYPGTQHTYWIYAPQQYDPDGEPVRLMIFNDGQAYMNPDADIRAQNVMDNLIYRREIPVMVGVFINPGRRPDQPEPTIDNWGDRDTNRPEEYNTLDDRYARVIVDELLPDLYKKYPNISRNPEHHGIGGSSSGAIAAWTVAWERPNDFRKVISMIGTYVNLRGRGGHRYPDMIREHPRKPIRVFLQDGRNDNRGRFRPDMPYNEELDWFHNNVRMQRALEAKGYDVNYVWGIGPHSSKHGGMILPDMMRWIWRDHPVSTDVNDMVERNYNGPAQ